MKKPAILIALSVLLSACAGYGKWADETNKKMNAAYTRLLMGEQKLELDPSVPKGLELELRYAIGEGTGIGAITPLLNSLQGSVTYDKSCPGALRFKVDMFNSEDALIQSEPVLVSNYQKGVKAVINKSVEADPHMSSSSQVSRLLVREFACTQTGIFDFNLKGIQK